MGFVTAAREVYGAGREEFVRASLGAKALLGANVVGILGEQFGGNEYVLGNVGGRVFAATHNIVLTGAGAGLSSFLIQAGLGLTTLISMKQFPKAIEVLGDKLGRGGKAKGGTQVPQESEIAASQLVATSETAARPGMARRLGSAALGMGMRLGIAFGSGSSLKAIDDNSLTKHTTGENVRSVLTDAGLVAGSVATIGAVAATGLLWGQTTGHEGIANGCVDVMTNPLPYLALSASLIWQRHRSGSPAQPAVGVPEGRLNMPAMPDSAPLPAPTMHGETI